MFEDGIHPVALLLGLAAAVWAFYVAGTMGAGIVMKIVVVLATTIVGFIFANWILLRN